MVINFTLKVSGLARRVHDSPTLKEKFDNLVQANTDIQGGKRTLDRRVSTRWNSDLACLDAHVHFRPVVEQLTAASANKLKAYQLNEKQWELAEEIQEALVVSNPSIRLQEDPVLVAQRLNSHICNRSLTNQRSHRLRHHSSQKSSPCYVTFEPA
jgi:hypothetical protein